MLTAYEVLTLLASLLVAFLLLSDVRDELLRKLKPLILRSLENAGVLTRDDYIRRSGIDQQQLQAIKQAQIAASSFAKQVATDQLQGSSASSSSSVIRPTTPTASSASASNANSNATTPKTQVSTPGASVSALSLQDGKDASSTGSALSPPSANDANNAGKKTRRPPKGASDAAASPDASKPEQQPNGEELEEQPELSREGSGSSRKHMKSDSRDLNKSSVSVNAAPPKAESQQFNAASLTSPSASAPAVNTANGVSTSTQTAAGGTGVIPSSAPAVASPVSTQPLQVALNNSLLPLGASPFITSPVQPLPAIPDPALIAPSAATLDNNGAEVSVNGSFPSVGGAVPLIAGYPLNQLTVTRSLDGDISVEEYFNASGDKVAWRRGNIWDGDFIYTLTKGLDFMKFGSWGSPHVRNLKFELDATTKQLKLDWGTGSILMDDVIEVRKGKTTQVFKRYAKDNANCPPYSCFSVITPKRTLDLSILVSKGQRVQEKRDLLVFGLGEVTGTRSNSGTDGANGAVAGSKSSKDKSLNGRRTSFSSQSSQGGTLSRGVSGDSSLHPGDLSSAPIPYQKVVEAIESGHKGNGPANGSTRSLYGNGGGGNSMLFQAPREEYSLSTRASQQSSSQQPVPVTPSASNFYYPRSNQSTPMTTNTNPNYSQANYSASRTSNGVTTTGAANNRGSIIAAPYASNLLLAQQQQQLALARQQQLLAYANANAAAGVHSPYLDPYALPPPTFPGSSPSGPSNDDAAAAMLRNSMLIGAQQLQMQQLQLQQQQLQQQQQQQQKAAAAVAAASR